MIGWSEKKTLPKGLPKTLRPSKRGVSYAERERERKREMEETD